MQKLFLVAGLLWLLSGCSGEQAVLANGDKVTVQFADSQWLVVNYWAIWCAPCREEIPQFNALAKQSPAISVLGVNYDGEQGERLQAQMQQLKVGFAVLLQDPAQRWGIARPQVLPTTLLIDPQGVLQATLVGPQTLESLQAALAQAGYNGD